MRNKVMKRVTEAGRDECCEIAITLTPEIITGISNFLVNEGVRKTRRETILLLVQVSGGKSCFTTYLEELAANYYADYFKVKAEDVKSSKNLKSNIRSRVSYLEKVGNRYFEVLSRKCAGGVCAAPHTKDNPCHDVMTIQLNVLTDWLLYTNTQATNQEGVE